MGVKFILMTNKEKLFLEDFLIDSRCDVAQRGEEVRDKAKGHEEVKTHSSK